MKSSTTTPSPFSTISTALMSPPTLPMALATAPSEPGRSGRVITHQEHGAHLHPPCVTAVFRVFGPRVALPTSPGSSRGSLDGAPLRTVPLPSATPTDDLAPLVAPAVRRAVRRRRRRARSARSPHNITHVDVPRGGDDRYERRPPTLLRGWRAERVLVADDRADLHDLPAALHRRHGHRRATSPVCSAGWRWSTRVPAGCCRTSAPRPRPRPTGWT